MRSSHTECQPLIDSSSRSVNLPNNQWKNHWNRLAPYFYLAISITLIFVIFGNQISGMFTGVEHHQWTEWTQCVNTCDNLSFQTRTKLLDKAPSDLHSMKFNMKVHSYDKTKGFYSMTTCDSKTTKCYLKELQLCGDSTNQIDIHPLDDDESTATTSENNENEATSNSDESCSRKIIESVDSSISSIWSYQEDLSEENTIALTFAIKQGNTHAIEDALLDVSIPSSPNYGKHWTYEQVHEFLKPSEASLVIVQKWLENIGITNDEIEYLTPNGDFLRVSMTISQANSLLDTKYGVWTNANDGTTHIRVLEGYTVPQYVSEHLDFVSPTLRFPLKRHTSEFISLEEANLKFAAEGVTPTYNSPQRLTSLYQMSDATSSRSETGSQAIASFIEEWFDDDDLTAFWDYFGLSYTSVTRVPDEQPSGYGTEAELDVQYITATGNGIHTYVWDVEDDLYFITLLQQIADSDNPPTVVSMSYGGDEQGNGESYCIRANVEFAKVGLLGVTFFASSGDDGCTGSSGVCGLVGEYLPSFPASSPFVVAVGGTYGGIDPADDYSSTYEIGWYNSGGGFSYYFNRSSWQDEAVDTFFRTATTSSLPESFRYNKYGRAYPDISAQAVYYIICVELSYWLVSGTSCASPSVAGMFGLINDYRIQQNKSVLGFVTPALYELFSSDNYTNYFNDVVVGTNEGCGSTKAAFSAQVGWDPVTGLGTPKFSNLLQKLIDL